MSVRLNIWLFKKAKEYDDKIKNYVPDVYSNKPYKRKGYYYLVVGVTRAVQYWI